MNPQWMTCKLGDVIELQRGFDLPEQQRRPGNIPIVSSSGITGTHSVPKVDGPGVVTGRYGTIGEVFYIQEPFWPLNTALFVKDFKGNDRRYINYLLKTVDFDSCADKGAVPGVNRNDLHELAVDKAPLSEQPRIARILGALDDKIELNGCMNHTLKAMAAAIFKSWFIDFDPVVAKADGRQPFGLDAETAALFPASFQDSELGPIPAGWKVGTIGEIGLNPKRPARPAQIPPETPYIGLEHMPRRNIVLGQWGRSGDVTSNKYHFVRGEILFGKLRPYFHKVGVAPVDGVCSTDVLVVVPQAPYWFGLLLGHLSSIDFINYVDAGSGGTRMPRTDWQTMADYTIALPGQDIASIFTSIEQPLLDLMRTNTFKSRTLTAVRDALLPKLLSGEIRMKTTDGEIEQFIAD